MRIVLSPRVVVNPLTEESFVALSMKWAPLLNEIFGCPELYIVDFGQKFTSTFFERMAPDLIILTGGDNLGVFPHRDEFEFKLLKWAIESQTKVLGICRGMQLINKSWGGENYVGSTSFFKNHLAQSHIVNIHGWYASLLNQSSTIVNSFHRNYIPERACPRGLKVLATHDNTIEAFISDDSLCLGIMWHPEREHTFSKRDKLLIKKFMEKTDDD
jgi:N5-(cytidine 5'-diphosphoramidyl)-L-glutamine hydrolase